MENVILVILLILALCLIGIVLLQRSEGGGLGIGGGGGLTTGRSSATALTKLTWVLGVFFMVASVAMTIIAARNSADGSVVDRFGGEAPSETDSQGLPSGEGLLPPRSDDASSTGEDAPPAGDDSSQPGEDAPLAPPRAE